MFSFLLIVPIVVFFEKDIWSRAGKTQWSFCLIGAIAATLFCTIIEYLNISNFLKMLLEIAIIIGIIVFFYTRYRSNYKNRTEI